MDATEIAGLKKDAQEFIIPHFADNAEIQKGAKIFVRGQGCHLYDVEGRKYLDTFSSLLTTVCGHGRPEVAAAAERQMRQLEFFPNYVDTFTVPLIELARKLAEIAPGDLSVSFFVNSGSEANETAIKMAKQYFWRSGEARRWKIIARRHSYCGTTLGGVSGTGIAWFREYFEPLMPGFIFATSAQCFHCELGLDPASCRLACLRELERIVQWENPESVAAVIIDPIPGSNAGYPLPPDGYLEGLRSLCDRYGILLVFDEVQTGFGKTGRWFACEHWGVTPDIMTLGKGLTGGYLPLGAAVTTPRIYDAFRAPGAEFRSGSTYGGHTTACATTLVNIGIIEKERLVERAAAMGKHLGARLGELYHRHQIVGDIRGIGMLWAVELLADMNTRKSLDAKLGVGSWIRDYCWQRGMILRNNGDILVIAPALVIAEDDVEWMLGLIDEAISAAEEHFELA